MADEGAADDLGGEFSGETSSKKGGIGGLFSGLLKWILIGVAGVILVVTIVIITNKIIGAGGNPQTSVPISETYSIAREDYDWYTSLDQIRTQTSDLVPASVNITIALGYKKDDKKASTEITSRRIEIIDFLRRFFSERTIEELKPKNEELLKQQIRDQINDDILSNSRIRAVMFTQKDVVQQ